MEANWYYFYGERRGPVAAEELIRLLSALPDPWNVRIWHEGMADWQAAGTVSEIASGLPPARPGSPGSVLGPSFFTEAEAIARHYRQLVLLVGVQLLAGYFRLPSQRQSTPSVLSAVASLVLFCILIALAVTAYKLTQLLGSKVPIVWAIVMFIPCVNILGLLALSSKAQAWCRQYGVKVGFFGPTKASIEELRQRVQTSHFD